MNYYIADLHFGHHSILSLTNRPFQCVLEMETALIERWNRKVTDSDEIYIIGDLFYQHDTPEKILSSLKGKKHLILGNHDSKWLNQETRTYFCSIQTSLELVDHNQTVLLCHYPMVSYPKQSRAYMIHGHIHNDTLFDYWPILLKRARILNAGVDINQFEPVTLKELIVNNERYKQAQKESYPLYLLSVRFHLNALKDHQLSKSEAYQIIHHDLLHDNCKLLKEGLYLLDNEEMSHRILDELKPVIQKDPLLNQIIKNFDLVHVDENGFYSYLDYLNQENIYIK